MSFMVKRPAAVEIAPDRLKPHYKQFPKNLVDQGYSSQTMRTCEAAARLLCEEAARRGPCGACEPAAVGRSANPFLA